MTVCVLCTNPTITDEYRHFKHFVNVQIRKTEEGKMQKSRRDLLKSAVAGGLTMGVLSKASAMPTDRPDKWDASYDVVVVGAGGAGLAAAAHAAEQGLKVLLLEKLAFVGGSSAICRRRIHGSLHEHQKKLGIRTQGAALSRHHEGGRQPHDPKVVQTFTDHVLEVYNWFSWLTVASSQRTFDGQCLGSS